MSTSEKVLQFVNIAFFKIPILKIPEIDWKVTILFFNRLKHYTFSAKPVCLPSSFVVRNLLGEKKQAFFWWTKTPTWVNYSCEFVRDWFEFIIRRYIAYLTRSQARLSPNATTFTFSWNNVIIDNSRKFSNIRRNSRKIIARGAVVDCNTPSLGPCISTRDPRTSAKRFPHNYASQIQPAGNLRPNWKRFN